MNQNKKIPDVDNDKCVFCLSCIDICGYNAVRLVDERIVINSDKCVSCYDCVNACPCEALTAEI